MHLDALVDEINFEHRGLHVVHEFGRLLDLEATLVVEVRVSAEFSR